jgi:glycosyltransferase involved in cell wall biosynthesis
LQFSVFFKPRFLGGNLRLFPKITGGPLRVFWGDEGPQESVSPSDVLFVSHEASRTGAPLIALNLIRHFNQQLGLRCRTLLNDGGPLIGDFAEVSGVECLNTQRCESPELTRKIRRFLRQERTLPKFAVCNSLESRFIAAELSRAGIPVIALIHEMASSYTDSDFHLIYQAAEEIVFPCRAVRNEADAKVPVPQNKTHVMPQGLLKPNFGKQINRADARQAIRTELGLPPESTIVLGCGTLDLRKGIDHFAGIARRFNQVNPESPVYFVWLGDGPRWTHSIYHYVQMDIEKSGLSQYVRFIGERVDVEPYFVGSDVFLLTSRVDPFPCVVHESMAAGLPIIAFEGSGGAAEALADGAGLTIPFADYGASVQAITALTSNKELHERLRATAEEKVRSQFRFSNYAEQIWNLAQRASSNNIPNRRAA